MKKIKKTGVDYQKTLDALTNKKQFGNKQEARRFFSALKVVIEKKRTVTKGWQCNFSDTIHAGPQNCASPELGGKYIIDEYYDKTTFDI